MTQPSPNELKFDESVKALLAEKHTHSNLKLRLRRVVMEEGQKLPPIKVIYSTSYGGLKFSEEFMAFLRSRSITIDYIDRSNPAVIQAISDYGRSLCDSDPRYRIEPDEVQDPAVYERNGLCGASTRYSTLAIREIPALVDYSIHEYDGLETVEY